MRAARIFPDFTKPHNQRVRSLWTPQQVMVVMSMPLAVMLGVAVNGVICVPAILAAYAVVVFWGLVPHEGATRGLRLLLGLRAALMPDVVSGYDAFAHTEVQSEGAVPVMVEGAQGVLLAAEVEAPK